MCVFFRSVWGSAPGHVLCVLLVKIARSDFVVFVSVEVFEERNRQCTEESSSST
jgi:hypothetical protein